MIIREKKTGLIGALSILISCTALAIGGIIYEEGTSIHTYTSQADTGYCTILIYMDGSNLENDYGLAANDLAEIETAIAHADAGGEQIHVVVEAGGAKQWQYEAMKECEYGRLCITGKGVSEVEDMDMRDMGRSDTLADFLNYGTQSYPAKHYGLICWNHGSGQIQGFGCDNNFNNSSLSLNELKKSFEMSDMQEPLDFIAMDACLMANIEMVDILQGKADYFIASEDKVPPDGYAYNWMEVFNRQNIEYNFGKTVGEAMLSTYEDYYKEKSYSVTLSLIDVNAYSNFYKLFDDAIRSLISLESKSGLEGIFQRLGQMRNDMQGFGKQTECSIAEQVDLMDFMQVMTEQASPELEHAISSLITSHVAKGYSREPCGLSIYLPGTDNQTIRDDVHTYDTIGFCANYQKFVTEYLKYIMENNPVKWKSPVQKKNEILLEIGQEQAGTIADAYLAVFYNPRDGDTFLICADGDVTLGKSGYLRATKETTFWGIQNHLLCLIENYNTPYITEYLSPILYKKPGQHWQQCLLTIEFSRQFPEGEITSIVPNEVSKMLYELENGDTLIPLYPLNISSESTGEMEQQDILSKIEGKIFDKKYYMGEIISIDNINRGDGALEKIKLFSPELLQYAFIIRDTKMELFILK